MKDNYPLKHMSLVMRKLDFCICENKDADQLRSDRTGDRGDSTFVFAIRIVHFLYYLYPKFQASSHLLWLYSLVCVGPGRKPRRPVFSQRGSYGVHAKYEYPLLRGNFILILLSPHKNINYGCSLEFSCQHPQDR